MKIECALGSPDLSYIDVQNADVSHACGGLPCAFSAACCVAGATGETLGSMIGATLLI
jgi:hypothetical protein